MAVLTIIAIAAVVVIVVKGLMEQSDRTKGYAWKINVYYDAKTGERYDLEPNYMNPSEILYYDPNKKQHFVKRQRKQFDKGPNSLYLTDFWDSRGLYDSWRLIINNVGMITETTAVEADYYKDQTKYLENVASDLQAKNLQLTMKADEYEEKQTEKARKRVIIPVYKKPGTR